MRGVRRVCITSMGDNLIGKLFLPESSAPAPAIILVHGAIDYKENFFELAEKSAAAGFAALALDMHGHGESAGERYHVRMQQWVPDVVAALDYLQDLPEVDASRIGAFGFSSGGTAVLESAILDSRLRALVTLDATVRPIVNRFEQGAFKFLGWVGTKKRKIFGSDLKLPLYKIACQQPVACDPIVSQRFLNDPYLVKGYKRYPIPGAVESLVVDTLERVGKISVPVCVIHGREDTVDLPETASCLYDELTSTKSLHIIPDSGHVGHMDRQKEKVFEIALNWFANHLS